MEKINPLTDAELESFEYHGCSSGTSTQPLVRDCIVRACAEIRDLRARLLTPDDASWLRGAVATGIHEPVATQLREAIAKATR
jgi:hypothetical protein